MRASPGDCGTGWTGLTQTGSPRSTAVRTVISSKASGTTSSSPAHGRRRTTRAPDALPTPASKYNGGSNRTKQQLHEVVAVVEAAKGHAEHGGGEPRQR